MLVKWQSVYWIAWWLSPPRNLSCISKVWHESDEIQLELVMNFLSLMILIRLQANRVDSLRLLHMKQHALIHNNMVTYIIIFMVHGPYRHRPLHK